MTDIEIAQECELKDIRKIAKKLDLKLEDLVLYGYNKAKINKTITDSKGKLVLVTAINPTPFGEGKTTVSIGLADALQRMKLKSLAVLREPSMGPVFGIKGGATGGGYSQIVPMDEINLHFTGDFHAITSANDLLCAAIDNHIFHGNKLDIQEVTFNRCLDVNDRALRDVVVGDRKESFSITAASEIMALFCMATSLKDLTKRLGNIIIGYNSKKEVIYAKDLGIEGSLTVLLKDAFLPNLVQTLEHTPVIVHGGPFANIAHGCNSVVATRLGLGLADYVITEAGFGADLGAEKFLDIKCRNMGISPDCIVLVATIKALKYNGGIPKDKVTEENVEGVKKGICNLERHIENLKKFGVNLVVCLNKYTTDTDKEIKVVKDFCNTMGVKCEVSTAYVDGGKGAVALAKSVIEACDKKSKFKLLYKDNETIKNKIEIICKEIYRAKNVKYSKEANRKIAQIEKLNKSKLPICVAKTQYSFSDDAKKLGAPSDYDIYVRDVRLYNGAGFITILLGSIMTMPGLPIVPNYEKIYLKDDKIVGLS